MDIKLNTTITAYNNPKCIDCNECCSMTTSITDKELIVILEYIKSNKKLFNKIKNKIMYFNYLYIQKETINFKCLFSDKDKKCMIYEIRPFACMEFHCDSKPEIFLQDKSYDILNVFNTFIGNHMSHKKELLKLIKVYKLTYEKILEGYTKNLLK